MNGLDIAILITLGIFTLKGLLRGLLKELCSLVGIIAGSFLAFYFHPPLADWLATAIDLPPRIGVVVAFMILFLATISLFALLGYLLSQSISALFLGGVNQIVGGCFGLAQGVVLLSVVLYVFSLGSLSEGLLEIFNGSELAPPFVDLGETVFDRGRDTVKELR